jgi:hypothetical protein
VITVVRLYVATECFARTCAQDYRDVKIVQLAKKSRAMTVKMQALATKLQVLELAVVVAMYSTSYLLLCCDRSGIYSGVYACSGSSMIISTVLTVSLLAIHASGSSTGKRNLRS